MEIKDSRSKRHVADIKPGFCFMYDHQVYMKMVETANGANAVRLSDGEPYLITDKTQVFPVVCTVEIIS